MCDTMNGVIPAEMDGMTTIMKRQSMRTFCKRQNPLNQFTRTQSAIAKQIVIISACNIINQALGRTCCNHLINYSCDWQLLKQKAADAVWMNPMRKGRELFHSGRMGTGRN